MKPRRTINYVSRQTGLSTHVIRIWEKRYGAVKPTRAVNNRRLYNEKDVERLKLLRQATDAGHSIGQVANASTSELERLLAESWNAAPVGAHHHGAADHARLVDAGMSAITAMNALRLQDVLDRAAIELGSPAILIDFVAPLAHEIGERWRVGKISIAQEHFASNLISVFLNIFARPFAPNESAPRMLVAAPSGQHHEIGAMVAAAAARTHGWTTTYLGASLPVEELLRAARAINPRAVGLSIVYPPDDTLLRRDLHKLDRYLAADCAVLLGGKSAANYEGAFSRHHPHVIPDVKDLFGTLNAVAIPPKRRSKSSSRS